MRDGPRTGRCAYKIRGLPESYTPKHLAEKILTSKAALEGERKQVTVLFADLKGSMELLADRDPEEARKLLDPVLEHMMEAVHRYEGTVNQVMGDGIMALFGAPLAHEDHAVRACYAALRMQESVEAATPKRSSAVAWRADPDPRGAELGRGGRPRHRQSICTWTTRRSARRPTWPPAWSRWPTPGTILLTPATLQLAEGYVAGDAARAGRRSRGWQTPIEIYELTGASIVRVPAPGRGAARGLTRFVGRDAEIEQLRRALEPGAATGHGQVVAVVGEPGVGKSRLVYEFTHSHRTQDWLILESGLRVLRQGDQLPAGHRPAEGATSRSSDRETTGTIREKVTGKLLALDRALEPMLPAFLALLDVPVEDAAWQSARSRRSAGSVRSTRVKRLLLRESQVQPSLVVFEDLHWIDAETQALLDGLVESLPTARSSCWSTTGPSTSTRWGSKTYYSQLRLDAAPARERRTSCWRRSWAMILCSSPLKRLLVERTGEPVLPRGERADARGDGGARGRARGLSAGPADPERSRSRRRCRRSWRPASTGSRRRTSGCSRRPR